MCMVAWWVGKRLSLIPSEDKWSSSNSRVEPITSVFIIKLFQNRKDYVISEALVTYSFYQQVFHSERNIDGYDFKQSL